MVSVMVIDPLMLGHSMYENHRMGKINRIDGSVALVTGGAGMIRSTLVDQLLAAGAAEVRVVDDPGHGRQENLDLADRRLHVVRGDLRDASLLDELAAGCRFVFHQRNGRRTRSTEDPRRTRTVLSEETIAVADAAIRHGIDKIIVASGRDLVDESPSPEPQPPAGDDATADLATDSERLLRSRQATAGLRFVCLRHADVYGPGMDLRDPGSGLLVHWMRQIEAGVPPVISSDDRRTMDLIFTTDVARAKVLAAVSDIDGGLYEIAAGTEVSRRELLGCLLEVMGSELTIESGPVGAESILERRSAGTAAAARDIGFVADVQLREGLRRLVDWWRGERRREADSAAARLRGVVERSPVR